VGEIIVKKDFSAAEEKKAALAAARFKKSKFTSAASNLLNVADLGNTVLLCSDHVKQFATPSVLRMYGYRQADAVPTAMGLPSRHGELRLLPGPHELHDVHPREPVFAGVEEQRAASPRSRIRGARAEITGAAMAQFDYDLYGSIPVVKKFQYGVTLTTAGIPFTVPASNTAGVVIGTTTGATDLVGMSPRQGQRREPRDRHFASRHWRLGIPTTGHWQPPAPSARSP
jgi:hypothetical protein